LGELSGAILFKKKKSKEDGSGRLLRLCFAMEGEQAQVHWKRGGRRKDNSLLVRAKYPRTVIRKIYKGLARKIPELIR